MLQYSPNLYSHDTPAEQKRCWVEIDGSALRANALFAKHVIGPNADILAVVKADAYGHGMLNAASEFLQVGITNFGVVNLLEAAALQDYLKNPAIKVCLLAPAVPGERAEIVARKIRPWLSSIDEALDYERIVEKQNFKNPFEVEIEIDTGMGRGGVVITEFQKLLNFVQNSRQLKLVGIVTHLSSPESNTHFTKEQLSAFEHLSSSIEDLSFLHAQNSAGLLGYPLTKGGTFVRPGLMLYGNSPIPSFQKQLNPALSLKSRITLTKYLPAGHSVSYGRTFITTKDTHVATIAIGYADGYPWTISNQNAHVLVRGVRCPILGRVTMDQIIIDIDSLNGCGVQPGEEVVLIGKQLNEEISVNEVALKSGTISYEIFTGLKPRNGRVYLS